MTARIRRIQAHEWPQLRALRLQALARAPMAFGSTLAHEQDFADEVWRERAAGASAGCERATFVAERGGQWVGLATGLAPSDQPRGDDALLVGMFVDEQARRGGVGIALIEAVAAWAQACGFAQLTLWVTGGNDPALGLYRRCGFRPTGVSRPLAHSPAHSEREMVRDLH
jgi:GNAT superfamily N-acetyltransferase